MERKIDLILKSLGKENRAKDVGEVKGAGALDIMTLLSLPDHLRKTALTLIKLGKATAEDVAKETGRARAIESAYLNQLVRMGYVWRERVGKRVYFTVVENAGGKGS
jgi:predicted transcriptional regulator